MVETAAAAGLLADRADADGNPVWVPTDAFDAWIGRDLAERWLTLAQAWLESPRMPGLVGARDADGKPWNALSPELAGRTMAETRAMTLAALAALPPGEVLAAGTGVPSLVARVAWLRPRRPRIRADQVAWTVAEAGALGRDRPGRAVAVRPRAARRRRPGAASLAPAARSRSTTC